MEILTQRKCHPLNIAANILLLAELRLGQGYLMPLPLEIPRHPSRLDAVQDGLLLVVWMEGLAKPCCDHERHQRIDRRLLA
jgi:hypothetical protein